MGIQYDILASTLRILRDREVDNTFRTIPLLEAVQRAGNVEMVNGGQKGIAVVPRSPFVCWRVDRDESWQALVFAPETVTDPGAH